jgi:hypothetical protein
LSGDYSKSVVDSVEKMLDVVVRGSEVQTAHSVSAEVDLAFE